MYSCSNFPVNSEIASTMTLPSRLKKSGIQNANSIGQPPSPFNTLPNKGKPSFATTPIVSQKKIFNPMNNGNSMPNDESYPPNMTGFVIQRMVLLCPFFFPIYCMDFIGIICSKFDSTFTGNRCPMKCLPECNSSIHCAADIK